ncbi:MAG: CHAP domain-containing protein [Kiloniellales bacterium]|nr:CHAP domain-containing protein [Kiloniellales bacterium]
MRAGFATPVAVLAGSLILLGCAPEQGAQPAFPSSELQLAAASARISTPSRPLQCVPYARRISGIEIRGDAWTWWRAAAGRYARRHTPMAGSVLVLGRSRQLRGGHIAVVEAVLNDRVILISHANWLNRGRVHENTPVVDVSPENDWSLVRIWYTPGRTLGGRSYPAKGFIYPKRPSA